LGLIQEMVDAIKEKRNERRTSRSWCEMTESTKHSSHSSTSEIVAYHKVKRKFLNLTDIEKEDPDKLQICEFKGQDFELIPD
jgi:hypothetical protein